MRVHLKYHNLRYGIVSARMKGMTPNKPSHRQAQTRHKAIFINGLSGINGACRVKPARSGKQGRYPTFVSTQQKQANILKNQGFRPFSFINVNRSVSMSLIRAFTAWRFACMSMRKDPISCRWIRYTSRMRRLIRFRVTAFPSFLETENATCLDSASAKKKRKTSPFWKPLF